MPSNLIILTTKENFRWASMQEILPGLEQIWIEIANKLDLVPKIIDVDVSEPKKFIGDYLKSKYIVVIAFNTQIAKFIHYIRLKIHCDTRIFFYLHGLATIGCWPLSRFGIANILRTNDVFIGTCDGDRKSLELTFEKFQYIQHLFLHRDEFKDQSVKMNESPLVFVGRISPQKNIHNLLKCYLSALKINNKIPPLYIYGKEDHLGAPNLGITNNNYLNELLLIIPQALLNTKIFFKGFQARAKIQLEIGPKHTFITTSVHSDENFGMAALRSLFSGANVILTDWGGHKNFKKMYTSKLTIIPVSLHNKQLIIDEEKLIHSLLNLTEPTGEPNSSSNLQFTIPFISKDITDQIALLSDNYEADLLQFSNLAKELIQQQNNFEDKNELQRCFLNYCDPIYLKYISQYL